MQKSLDILFIQNYIFCHEQNLWTEHRSSKCGKRSKHGSSTSLFWAVQRNKNLERITQKPDKQFQGQPLEGLPYFLTLNFNHQQKETEIHKNIIL